MAIPIMVNPRCLFDLCTDTKEELARAVSYWCKKAKVYPQCMEKLSFLSLFRFFLNIPDTGRTLSLNLSSYKMEVIREGSKYKSRLIPV